MKRSISDQDKELLFDSLREANLAFQNEYPGERPDRQPVHTVYGGADLFKYNTAESLGRIALRTFLFYAPDYVTFGKAFGIKGADKIGINNPEEYSISDHSNPAWLSQTVYKKVIEKLKNQAVEDFRIDFEDGFGNRSEQEEDETAENAARQTAMGMEQNTLPPFIGIRIKPFTEEMKSRGVRTLDIYISTLLEATKGKLPNNFVVMLPKVTIPEQVSTLVSFFELLESAHNLKAGTLKMEMMVETTQSILDKDGINPLYRFIRASKGRCIAVHFGTYDYTASNNITAMYQEMDHPVCDFAHHMTKVALAHTGVWLSDGATNTMPIGPHRGENPSQEQLEENRKVVHRAWNKGYRHIRHSLWNGYYQGWDLNPAQLPMRYAAVYSFFLESYQEAADRLRTFVEKAARATLIGDIFDDAATGQGLLNYFLRALNCGVLSEEDIEITGLTLEEIRMRSFKKILDHRNQKN